VTLHGDDVDEESKYTYENEIELMWYSSPSISLNVFFMSKHSSFFIFMSVVSCVVVQERERERERERKRDK
jgi:hypothetical protein